MKNSLLLLEGIGDGSVGCLSFFESKKDIPFEIKRVYYTYNVPKGTKRGKHAHKELQQALWCPYGEIEVLLDNGNRKKDYLLNSPDKLLLVGKGIWREMNWIKDNSVLCVAASDYYNEDDYIRDYKEFIEYVEKGYWDNENRF